MSWVGIVYVNVCGASGVRRLAREHNDTVLNVFTLKGRFGFIHFVSHLFQICVIPAIIRLAGDITCNLLFFSYISLSKSRLQVNHTI